MANREYNVVANFIARTQSMVDGFNDTVQGAQETANKVEGAFNGLQGTFQRVAGWIATAFAVDKIKDFTVGMIETTADIQALEGQYEQVMGGMKGTTDKYIDEMSAKWNKHPNDLKGALMQYMAILKGKGLSEQEAYETAQKYMQMTVDGNAFANESMADSVARSMGIIKGEYDSADSIMINFSQTLLNDIAVRDYGKKWDELTVAQQENIKTMEAIRQQTSAGVLGQAGREADSYANNLAMVKNKWDEILAQFGSPLLVKVNEGLGKLSDTLSNVNVDSIMNGFSKIKEWILAFLPSVDNLKTTFSNLMPIFGAVGGTIAAAFQYLASYLPTIVNGLTGVAAKFSEWEGFIPVIAGLVTAFVTYQGILKAMAIWETTYQAIQKASLVLYNMQRAAVIAYGLAGGGVQGILAGMRAAVVSLNLAFLANPIVLVIAAIVGLGAALVVAYKKSETFRNIVDGAWQSLKDGFSAVVNWCTTTIPVWIENIKTWFTNLKNSAISIFSNIWSSISSAAQTFFSFIMSILQPFITFFVNSWENLKLLVLSIVTGFFSLLTGDFEGVKLALLGIITAFKDQFINYWNLLKDTVVKVAVMLWEGIKNGFSAGKDFVINKAIELYNGVINWFSSMYTKVGETVNKVEHFIKDGFTKAKDGAIDLVIKLYNGVVDWIKAIPGKVTDMKDDMVKTLKGIDLKQLGKDAIQGFIDGITEKIGKVWEKVKEIADGLKTKLQKALDIHSPSRVMFEIGGYVGEGLALGIEGTKSLVENAALSMAEASNFANNFSSFKPTVQGLNNVTSMGQQEKQQVNNSKTYYLSNFTIQADNPMELFNGLNNLILSE
jgi:phage-related protein